MFVTAGLSTIFVFFAIDFSDKTTTMTPQFFWFAFGGYVYIQGAVLYVLRVPERCKPGAFDLCGASH
jgi:adiponectin receptor